MPDVIVIGAGITGLTCAYRLNKLGFDTVVLDSSDRCGGVIRTARIEDHVVEWGPSSMLPTLHTFELLEEVGLAGKLIQADPKSPRYIVVDGKMKKVPFGPLSFGGIARMLAEPFIRSKSTNDESIANFVRRRLGNEAHDRLAAPALSGIYAGDTEKLSVRSCLPRIVEMEQKYGSVFMGMLRGRSDKPKPRRGATISSFPEGLEILPRELARGIDVRLNSSGVRIGKDIEARATVLAIPSYQAAEIVENVNPDAASLLRSIEYEPIVIAATSLSEDSMHTPLRGFGFLVPQSERLNILGTVFTSCLFPGRAPKGRILLNSFLGGALKPEVFDWPEARVFDVVCSELKKILGSSLQPKPIALFRHRRAIPQYNVGHGRKVEELSNELRKCPGLFVSGNFLDGVSVPACMERGDKTAQAVAAYLRNANE